MSTFKDEELAGLFDIQGINYFIQVAESGGFSKAAAVLNVPQPTLSRYIRRLEGHFNVRLFDRNGRGALLTEAGTSLYQHAKAIFLRLQQAEADIAEISRNPAGSVVLGLAPIAGNVLSAAVARRFLQEVPNSQLRIVESFTGYILEWVANGRVDVGILYEDALTPTLEGERLWDETLVMVSARIPDFIGINTISFAELEKIPLILPGRPHGLRLRIDEVAANAGVRLNVVLEVDSLNTILDLVHKGIGCSVLTPPALYGYAHGGEMILTKLVRPTVVSHVVAVTSKQRPMTSTTKTLMQIIREESRTVRSSGRADIGIVRKTWPAEVIPA
jgi:LysR family transcriptional regulator, nitrogen assimilation regulatory protein